MPTRLLAAADHPERDRLLWLLISGLAIGLFVAFWALCQSQVDKAQARHAALRAERVAMADCMGATFLAADGTLVRAAPGPRCAAVPQRSGKAAD